MKREKEVIVQEKCTNPFRRKRCGNTNIKLYIVIKGVTYNICEECWTILSEGKLKDKEWSSEKLA